VVTAVGESEPPVLLLLPHFLLVKNRREEVGVNSLISSIPSTSANFKKCYYNPPKQLKRHLLLRRNVRKLSAVARKTPMMISFLTVAAVGCMAV